MLTYSDPQTITYVEEKITNLENNNNNIQKINHKKKKKKQFNQKKKSHNQSIQKKNLKNLYTSKNLKGDTKWYKKKRLVFKKIVGEIIDLHTHNRILLGLLRQVTKKHTKKQQRIINKQRKKQYQIKVDHP